MAEAVLAPSKKTLEKRAKKAQQGATKKSAPPPPRKLPPAEEDDDDDEVEEIAELPAPKKPRVQPVDVTQCMYHISCVTHFGDLKKNLKPDSGDYHLGDFDVHKYNAKAIKAVEKDAAKNKIGFKLVSTIATISGQRIKNSAKEIDEPSDWEALEKMISNYMKDRIKMLRVDYVVVYEKTRKRIDLSHSDDHEDSSDEDLEPVSKRRKVIFSCLIMLI
jgi:hypothetical protein